MKLVAFHCDSLNLKLVNSNFMLSYFWGSLHFHSHVTLHPSKLFQGTIGANVPQPRNVGLFGALTCPPMTKVATKNEPCGNRRSPHVFLGAVGHSYIFTSFNSFTNSINSFKLESAFDLSLPDNIILLVVGDSYSLLTVSWIN